MATKLDEQFVAQAKANHPAAAGVIDTLANEVRRLEAYCAALESFCTPSVIAEASEEAAKK